MSVSAQNQQGSQIIIEGDHNHLQINDFKTLTHRITLPDGTAIEFFASDDATFQENFGNFEEFRKMPTIQDLTQFLPKFYKYGHTSRKAKIKAKKARKQQRKARRK